MFDARDDDHARHDHDRDRIILCARATHRRGRMRCMSASGIGSADHRSAKIIAWVRNRPSDPESATRGETGRFESFSSPEYDPLDLLSSLLRGGDALMQHLAPS